jgi:hypothetical protein
MGRLLDIAKTAISETGARTVGEPGPDSVTPTQTIAPARTPAQNPAQNLGPLASCGSANCAGCYSVAGPDGMPRRIHPPKASTDWEEWLRRWQPKGGRKQ